MIFFWIAAFLVVVLDLLGFMMLAVAIQARDMQDIISALYMIIAFTLMTILLIREMFPPVDENPVILVFYAAC